MRRNYLLLAVYTSVFLAFGLVFIYSAGISVEARNPAITAAGFLQKQLVALMLGLIAALVIVYFKGSNHFKYSMGIYYPMIITLLAVVLLVPSTGGAKRWINLRVFNLQASEFAKIFLILFLARLFGNLTEEKKKSFFSTVIMPFAIAFPIIALVLIEPDLSTSGILVMITLVMMIIGGTKPGYIFLVLVSLVAVAVMAYFGGFIKPYQLSRITSFIQSLSGNGGGHEQVSYSLMAISSGGVFGQGLGLGTVKYYLPVNYSDFIFATIGEELGLTGLIVLMLAYIGFVRTLIIAGIKGAASQEGKLYICGFALYILIQSTMNIAVNLGLFPPTGVTLPFVSYGGSSLISLLVGFGLVFSLLVERGPENG